MVLLALGMLGNGLYQVLFVEGLALTRAGDAALVVSASPALMAIIGRAFGVERVSRRGIAGIILSLAGMVCVVLGGAEASTHGASITGDLLVLAGSVCWAVYTVLLTPYTRRVDGVVLSAYTMAGGLLVILVAAFPALVHTVWSAVPSRAWGAVVQWSWCAGDRVPVLVSWGPPARPHPDGDVLESATGLRAVRRVGHARRNANDLADRWRGEHHGGPGAHALVKLVLLDLDGTLLTSDGAGRRAIQRALVERFGVAGPEDHWFDGKTDPQIVRELMQLAGVDGAQVEAEMARVLSRYVECLHEELRAAGKAPSRIPRRPAIARRA